MKILSEKVKVLNNILLNKNVTGEKKEEAEIKLLAISELIKDHPILDLTDDLIEFAKEALNGTVRLDLKKTLKGAGVDFDK